MEESTELFGLFWVVASVFSRATKHHSFCLSFFSCCFVAAVGRGRPTSGVGRDVLRQARHVDIATDAVSRDLIGWIRASLACGEAGFC